MTGYALRESCKTAAHTSEQRILSNWLPVSCLAAAFVVGLFSPSRDATAQRGGHTGRVVLYDKDSRYYRIRVVDEAGGKKRCLYFSRYRGVQSKMLLAEPNALDFGYARSMIAALAFKPEAKNVLLIGLGGASLPKFIQKHFPRINLDIVEIDPDVVSVAKKYFFFEPAAETRIFVMDGRMFLKRVQGEYDVILLDAFAGDRIPFHLTTKEFLELVQEHLTSDGVVASNLWSPGDTRFVAAETATYLQVFPHVYRFHRRESENFAIFGAKDPKRVTGPDWIRRATDLARDRALGFDLAELIVKEYACWTDVKLRQSALTDEKAPVNILMREQPKHFEEAQPEP